MKILNLQGESYTRRIEKLKGEVRTMLCKVVDPLQQLEVIDIIQRLGVSYHFESDIRTILESIYNANDQGGDICLKEDLYATALAFRLLRQHGYSLPQGNNNI